MLVLDPIPERPLECSDCKKSVAVFYTEIVGNMVYRVALCGSCPMLTQKLFGTAHEENKEKSIGLCCGTCKTTIEEIERGSLAGCSVCYEIFEDLLVSELINRQKISQKVAAINKFAPMHRGKHPGELKKIDPSSRLMELHQALHETLSREEYEQAAWLRDQIKILTEGTENERA